MASFTKQILLLLILASLLIQGGCSRDPGIHLDLQITRIHLMQGGPLLLNLEYRWQRDAGFTLDYQRPLIYVHFLNEDKEIFFQDDHLPPPDLLFGDGEQTVQNQRCCILLNTEPELYQNLERSQIRIRVGFYEKTEMTKKHEVLDTRLRPAPSPAGLPTVIVLPEAAAPPEGDALVTSLPQLLPSSTIRGPGALEPLDTRLIPQEQLSLIRDRATGRAAPLGIEMPAETSAEFVLRPAAGSRLVFTPQAGTGAIFRVKLRQAGGTEQTLLERTITGEDQELSLDLPIPGDEVIGLRLECGGPGSGIWANARVVEPAPEVRPDRELQGKLVEIRDAVRDWNVILVILDATRADALSCYGHAERTTPTLDRIANSSIQFIESHSSAPYTISSTASLFSGLHPATHRVLDWKDRLWEGFPVLAEALSEAGMLTTAVIANPCISRSYGMHRGFDHFIVVPQVKDGEMDSAAVNDCLEQLTPHLADAASPPYYLYLHYLEPHMPYDPPEPIRGLVTGQSTVPDLRATRETIRDPEHQRGTEREEQVAHFRALYHGNLTFVDFQLAKALARMRREGLLDRTLLIITSDHGEAFMEHDRMLHGSTVYSEEILVPLLIQFPPPLEMLAGISRHPVNTVDTTAFLLQLLGPSESSLGRSIEGQSYLPALLGRQDSTRKITLVMAALNDPNAYGLYDDEHSLVVGPHGVELFDRVADPYELSPNREPGSLNRAYLLQRLLAHLTTSSCLDPAAERSGGATVDQTLKNQLVALGYAQD